MCVCVCVSMQVSVCVHISVFQAGALHFSVGFITHLFVEAHC